MKKTALRLTAVFALVLTTISISLVAPTSNETVFGTQQAQAASKKPSVVVKRDSKGRKTSYRKTTYYASGKKKAQRYITYNWNGTRKETDRTTKYYKNGKRSRSPDIAN